MPAFRIQDAADFLQGKKVTGFFAVIKKVARIFNFHEERSNRLKRFIEVVHDYKNGMLIADIQEKYDCSRFTVLHYARRAGCPVRERGFEPGIKKAAMDMYDDGKPIAQIQARFGVSQAWISKTANELGKGRVKFKKKGKLHGSYGKKRKKTA